MSKDTQVPNRSRVKYNHAYQEYRKWCFKNDIETTTDDSIITYFTTDLAPYKSSSLWTKYSMLRTTIKLFEGIDISTFPSIIPFLKSKSDGQKTTKCSSLTKEHVDTFLAEADNKDHLLNKVILIFGVAGACRRQELASLTTTCVEDRKTHFLVQIFDAETKNVRFFVIEPGEVGNMNVIDIIRMYIALRPTNLTHDRFFINYLNEKCTIQPVGIHRIAKVPQIVAKYLGLEDPSSFTGHCFRRTSASILANAGVTMGDIKRHTEWHSSAAPIACGDESENSILGEGTSTAELGAIDEIEKTNNQTFCGIEQNASVTDTVTKEQWTREMYLRVIDEYRQHEMLWNINSPDYDKKDEKEILWKELAKKFNTDPEVFKKRIDNMRGTYRSEKSKYKRSLASGDIYKSSWFAYESFKFLDPDDSTTVYIKQEYNEDEKPCNEYYDPDESMDVRLEDLDSLAETEEDNASHHTSSETVTCEEKQLSDDQPAKRKRPDRDEEILVNALGCLTRYSKDASERLQDECSIFGELVTQKMRKLDEKSRAIAEHKIQNIFYELQMARFDVNQESSSSQTTYQLYENNHVPESPTLVTKNNIDVSSESVNGNAPT